MSREICAFVFAALSVLVARAQEAASGFDLRATLSAGMFEGAQPTEAPRYASPWTGGIQGEYQRFIMTYHAIPTFRIA